MKKLGLTVDGMWKVNKKIDVHHYELVNELNGRKIKMLDKTLDCVISGKTSVSKIMAKRIKEHTIKF